MRSRSPLTIALLAGWAATVVAAASCGTEIRLAADADGAAADVNAVGDGGSAGDAPEGGSMQPDCGAALESDPAHCGACGHSCGGAACVASACVPELVGPAHGYGAPAHVAIAGSRGVVTDGLPSAAGGYVFQFDSQAAQPSFANQLGGQDGPSLATVGANTVYFTYTSDRYLALFNGVEQPAGAGNYISLASSPSGTIIGARVAPSDSSPHEVRLFDEGLNPRKTFSFSTPGKGRNFAFASEDVVLVAVEQGVDLCNVPDAGGTTCVRVSDSAPNSGIHVAAAGSDIFFTTSSRELRHGSVLGGLSSTVILSDVTGSRAVAADATGAYVLDDVGVRTTRYGVPALVLARAAAAGAIFDFALSPPWVYFITASGLYRVRL